MQSSTNAILHILNYFPRDSPCHSLGSKTLLCSKGAVLPQGYVEAFRIVDSGVVFDVAHVHVQIHTIVSSQSEMNRILPPYLRVTDSLILLRFDVYRP